MFNKRGFTLIEMVIAIVIIGIGVTGLLIAFSSNVRTSADPLISKQLVAAAEEMMEEILLKPYSSSPAATGGSYTCTGSGGVVRNGFDDVLDYNGYQTSGICDIDGAAVTGLTAADGYSMQVTATNIGTWQGVPNTLQITVSVSKGNATMTLTNWRTDPGP